jgi:hypothetical protein
LWARGLIDAFRFPYRPGTFTAGIPPFQQSKGLLPTTSIGSQKAHCNFALSTFTGTASSTLPEGGGGAAPMRRRACDIQARLRQCKDSWELYFVLAKRPGF